MSRKPHVIFYTRRGCHLCEEARLEILASGCEGEYTFEEVDIEADPRLKALYGWDIPVVRIDSVTAFKHRLTAAQFARALRSKDSKARMKDDG